jgi:quercetin dioxygenase-like cupin family protein
MHDADMRSVSGKKGDFMASMQRKSFDTPDEKMASGKIEAELVTVDGMTIARIQVNPGWRWSVDEGTPSCPKPHIGYVIAGRMVFQMDDGSQMEVGPHDAFVVPPGHNAWAVGDEPCVVLDFAGVSGASAQP